MTAPTKTLYGFIFKNMSIKVEGSVEDGGRIKLSGEDIGDDLIFKLPPTLFALVSVLARRSLSVLSLGLPVGKTFVKKHELYKMLKTVGHASDVDLLNKYTHNTRNRIEAEVAIHLNAGADHFRQLIETSELGIRLSVPPRLIEEDVIDWDILPPDPGL
ncbi:MAG: hypothetical protein DWQ34_06720 [Planctomycetota bacterium]|nr:MAG: hypothetical protein DWQ29_23760 [Planctomycetota bacterium]REJ95215.1 MAG: hypothetical protein DWQ34_06720 [Planctomycetota bacterium]REK25060.1 MAG: hypothetical protein DWQ41_12870 [Planctomycetota bacterium]REK28125.1 MAG: hypothetical protein DWQ45_25195 [Planctomycetota bacterium]